MWAADAQARGFADSSTESVLSRRPRVRSVGVPTSVISRTRVSCASRFPCLSPTGGSAKRDTSRLGTPSGTSGKPALATATHPQCPKTCTDTSAEFTTNLWQVPCMSLRASRRPARLSQPLAGRDCFVGLRPPCNDISLVLTATVLSYTPSARPRTVAVAVCAQIGYGSG